MSVNREIVSTVSRAADTLLSLNNNGETTEKEIEESIAKAINFVNVKLTEEDMAQAKKDLLYKYQVYSEPGKSILANYEDEHWYENRKAEIDEKFWIRYKNYLIDKKNFSPNIVSTLGNDTLDQKLMNYIGDPNSKNPFLKRGLIIGDVQSGKTSTYIGFMCKAADAGYKVFILLTGTTESLRKQTQERVEEGFIGVDMSASGEVKRVGVGNDNKAIFACALTSRLNDFTENVDKIAMKLSSSDAVVFVVKKNSSVLNNLKSWLIDLNADPITHKIDVPMLLIDDEADNASINTSKSREDPTKINKLIRELVNVFTKSNYVGFTATPFANVFIDPLTTESMENSDLFPEDFIVALPTPSNYIGPQNIFPKKSEHHDQLVYIHDAGCTEEDGWPFYFKHKKEWHDQLPESLTDAIYTFYLANALRDLRGDVLEHRSMLINISRFIKVQKYTKECVEEIHDKAYRALKYNLDADNLDESLKDPIIKRIYDNWKKQYSNTEYSWENVARELFSSIENIQINVVNSGKNADKFTYPKNESVRVIAIGGLALSRGLTLEGLIVSYFFRNTCTYDVLMQMGRWFGYRKNYEDLFRIWTYKDSAEWYAEIAEATDALKNDMDIMREMKKKPSNFGIRVRNDCKKLRITASNKMRATVDEYEQVDFSGDIFETPYMYTDAKKNIANYKLIENLILKCDELGNSYYNDKEKHLSYCNIPKSYIVQLLSSYQCPRENSRFDTKQICEFIEECDDAHLNNWDIVFMEGANATDPSKIVNINGKTVKLVERHRCQINLASNLLKLSSRGKLGGTSDGSACLTNEQINEAKRKFTEEFSSKSFYSSNIWFKYIKDRNPLLIVYFIDVEESKDNRKTLGNKSTEEIFKENMQGFPVTGLAVGFPADKNSHGQKKKYRVNRRYNYFDQRDGLAEMDEE